MIVKWTDKKSVFSFNKKTYRAGDVIPADELEPGRIDYLKKMKKILIIENEIIENAIPVMPELTESIEMDYVVQKENAKRGSKSKKSVSVVEEADNDSSTRR